MNAIIPYKTITLPTPFAVGPVNVYLIKANPLTLIDAGPYTREAEELLADAFKKQGLSFNDLEAVVVTHSHPDHSGLAPRLRELSGARIYLHEVERKKLEVGFGAFNERRVALMREAGVPEHVLKEFDAAMAANRRYIPALDDVVGIRDGHVFRFGEFSLMALHVAGHSAGQICLYEPRNGVLFSGDHLLSAITPNPMIEPSEHEAMGRRKSLVEYLESLKALREFEISLVLPGHGDPIYDHVAAIDRLFEHHKQRTELLYSLISDAGETAYSLAMKVFPGLSGFDVFLGVSEVAAHLDVLVSEGRVGFRREKEHLAWAYVYYRSKPKR